MGGAARPSHSQDCSSTVVGQASSHVLRCRSYRRLVWPWGAQSGEACDPTGQCGDCSLDDNSNDGHGNMLRLHRGCRVQPCYTEVLSRLSKWNSLLPKFHMLLQNRGGQLTPRRMLWRTDLLHSK